MEMEMFKQECIEDATEIQTINLGYAGETYHQLPIMVELKHSTVGEDQKVQLFNINQVQLAQPQIQYVAQKIMPPSCMQTQTIAYQEKSSQSNAKGQRSVDTQTVTEKPYSCEICGKSFKNLPCLARHHSVHPEIPKGFACLYCEKKFSNPQALRKHQTRHPEIVHEWKCRFCPQSFPFKMTLSRHVKVHAGEKLFKCEICLKRFGNRYSLLRHVKLHTGEVPYKCEVCEKGFLKASDFGRHVRTHTGEKPFECPECFQCFAQKSCLVKHAVKKHNLNNF